MPRRRAAPARKPAAPSRQQSTANSPPRANASPPPAATGSSVPAAPQQGGGMLSGLAGTMVTGAALGAGSEVAHRAIGSLFSSGESAPQQAAEPVNQMGASDACANQAKAFTDCISTTNGDMGACQFYFDTLQQCKAARISPSLQRCWKDMQACSFHEALGLLSPQCGGYMVTGQAAQEIGWGSGKGPQVLVTGAGGQIGAELVPMLRKRLGVDNVIASDVRSNRVMLDDGPFVYCDVQDKDSLARILLENGITTVVHLATLLSAIGEKNPQLALKVNATGIQNILDLAATHKLRVYSPSTIAVFGQTTPKHNTPDVSVMQPSTMYGITKVHQELLGQYYSDKFGVDYRSLRYPGVISSHTLPGGGTTDYAIEIFYAALLSGEYTCFLSKDAALPMVYMPDCLKATYDLMMAPRESLTQCTYNVTAMTFTPEELSASIRKLIPQFKMQYAPDFRESIAKTWPVSLDDSAARRDWNWNPHYNIDKMTEDMISRIDARIRVEGRRAHG